MMFEIKTLPAQEFKVNFDDGTFEGFCAHYGNIDQGDDLLLPGSGKSRIIDTGKMVPIFYSHGWKENQPPIGISLSLSEQIDGMWTKGKISQTTLGRDVLTLMDEGAIDCMSIGWNPIKARRMKTADGKAYREVAEYDMIEYSLCPKGFAMNPEALLAKSGLHGIITKSRWIGNVTGLIDVGGGTSWLSVIDNVMSAVQAFYADQSVCVYHEPLDISDSAVIYNVWDWDGRDEILQMGYAMGEGGAVTLDGNPRPVDIQVTYVTSGGAPVDVTGDNVDPKDWKGMRAKVHETDPVGLLIDEAAYIHDLAKTLKAEGRDEEVRVALTELASAKSLIEEHLKDAAPAPSLTEQIEKIRAAGERLRQR